MGRESAPYLGKRRITMSSKNHKPNIETVLYLGQQVPKKHFRAFIYDTNNIKRLANSWDEFQKLTSTGVWFASPQIKKIKTSALNKVSVKK